MSKFPPIKEQLLQLVHVQELDLQIDQIHKKKSGFPGKLKSLQDQLEKLTKSIVEKEAALVEVQKSLRQTEAAIELNQDRMNRSEKIVNDVTNQKQHSAVKREIQQLTKMNEDLNAKKTDTKKAFDGIQAEIQSFQEQVKKITEEKETLTSSTKTEESTLNADLSRLTGERSKFTVNVDPQTLRAYDRVRLARAGIGIVPAVSARCKGCNMTIPPQVFNQVHRGSEVAACPNCGRLLFMPVGAASSLPDEESKSARGG